MTDLSEIDKLHQRYQQQAVWTAAIRGYLSKQVPLDSEPLILEVGCGSGVILHEIKQLLPDSRLIGIDLDLDVLNFANEYSRICDYAQSDAVRLPFPDNSFDVVVCHFFLLWARPLNNIIDEIKRVLKNNSPFMVLAEPDYGGRIDYPTELTKLGELQEQSLQQQGAHTRIGRELPYHLNRAGFQDITTGILGGEWRSGDFLQNQERATLERDLLALPNNDKKNLQALFELDHVSRLKGVQILFVPTFYAVGYKK